MDARTEAWLDQADAHVAAMIRRHGIFIQYVGGGSCSCPDCDGSGDEGPAFAYTVGLFGLGHPELLIFDVSPNDAMGILNPLASRIRAGENFVAGQLLTIADWPYRILPEAVPNAGDIVFTANRFYARPNAVSVPVLQLSYQDEDGVFPSDPRYSGPEFQPRPGAFRA